MASIVEPGAMTADRALTLIAVQFPLLPAARATPLAPGGDNHVFLVDDVWVFRFPRHADAAAQLDRELQLLPRIAGHLPVATPSAAWRGRASSEFPWTFVGYRFLPAHAQLPTAATAESVGRFLRALHTIDVAVIDADSAGTIDVAARHRRALDELAGLDSARFPRSDEVRALLNALATPAAAGRPLAIVHADLSARHVLLDAAGNLTGVIDWGGLHVGDVARDLSIAYSLLPAPLRARFFAAYGAVDAETERLARFRALAHAITVARVAVTTSNGALLDESSRSFANLRD